MSLSLWHNLQGQNPNRGVFVEENWLCHYKALVHAKFIVIPTCTMEKNG